MADFNKNIKINVDINEATKSINELEKEIVDLTKELDSLAQASIDADEETVKSLQKAADAKIKIIKKNQSLIEKAYKVEQDAAKKTASEIEKAEKKEADAIKKTADEAEKVAKEEANILKESKNANKERSEAIIEAAVRITQALVTTTGTILAFASSEEDAAEVTAKLGKAMAIADSIEQVYNATKAIGEVINKSQAASEAQKAAAVVAGTVATEGATVATGFLSTAINTLLGPIGLVILGVGAVIGIYKIFSKSAADTAKEQNKLNESVANFADATDKARDAQNEANRAKIKDGIENQRKAIKDEQKAAEDFRTQTLNEEKKLEKDLKELRDKGSSDLSEQNQKVIDALFNNRFTKQKKAQADIDNLVKKSADFEVDVNTNVANQLLDLDIEKLASNQDLASKKIVLEKEYEKEINNLNARISKGDSTANTDKLIALENYNNNKIALNNEALDIELAKRNEVTDKELQDLSLIDTKTARFQEIELNRQKAIDEYNTAISKGEIKSAEELARINNDANTQTIALLKEIQNETKAIGDETKNISLDLLVSDLNKITQDIGADKGNQLKAIAETTKSDLEKLDEEYAASLKKLGTITTDAQKEQAKALKENYDVKVKVIKKGEEDATKVVEENINLRTFAQKSALQDIEEFNKATLDKILKSEKEALDVRIKANEQLVNLQLARIELQEKEAVRQAVLANKTQEEIAAIRLSFFNLKVAVQEVGVATEKALILNDFTKKIETVQGALTKLSEIKLFSDNAGINNFLNTITGLEKGLNGALEVFKKFKKDTLTAEDVAAFASSLVDITSSVIQNAFQQNIDNFNKQIEQLKEKKAEIEEDLQTSADKIKDLQGNLAQANIEDRSRIIKLIEKERQREKQLADQKKKAIQDEKKLQERIKEEKKKAFEAQKAAAIIQVIISTALGVIAPWGNPLTVTAAPVISALVGALGAAQLGIIASQPTPEFFEGGHTERGNSKEVAGVVHKNEWVAPAWMVESPKYRNNIQELEAARKGGFATGGFTSSEQSQSVDVLNRTILSVEALANRPVVVSVQEINSVSNSVNKVKVRSTL